VKLVKRLRVVVRRQPKMMVIILLAENGENVERRSEDCLNSSGLPLPEKYVGVSSLPVCTRQKNFSSPWEDE